MTARMVIVVPKTSFVGQVTDFKEVLFQLCGTLPKTSDVFTQSLSLSQSGKVVRVPKKEAVQGDRGDGRKPSAAGGRIKRCIWVPQRRVIANLAAPALFSETVPVRVAMGLPEIMVANEYEEKKDCLETCKPVKFGRRRNSWLDQPSGENPVKSVVKLKKKR